MDGEIQLRMDTPKLEILDKVREELVWEAEQIRGEDEARHKREELLESMNTRPFWHYCEVCGKKEFITAKEAFDSGWDYPPKVGHFGLFGSRKCGSCMLTDTLFWRVNTNKKIPLPIVVEGALTPEELVTWKRIKGNRKACLMRRGDASMPDRVMIDEYYLMGSYFMGMKLMRCFWQMEKKDIFQFVDMPILWEMVKSGKTS